MINEVCSPQGPAIQRSSALSRPRRPEELAFPSIRKTRHFDRKKNIPMTKVLRCMTVLMISVAFATASITLAQTYTTIDYPGAIATTLDGGPNPEGTNIGTWTDTAGVVHGLVLKDRVFTSFDPPGSTATTPNWISPQEVIVAGYVDSTGANHGFAMDNGQYTTIDFPGAAGTISLA